MKNEFGKFSALMRHLGAAGSLLICALLMSCAGSGGVWLVPQGQPHAEFKAQSITKEAFAGRSSRTYIRKINGKGVEDPLAVYRVSPGPVRLAVENLEGTLSGQGEIVFQAKEGRSYLVKSDQAAGMKVKFWVEDAVTQTELAASFSALEISDEKRPRPSYVPIFIPVN